MRINGKQEGDKCPACSSERDKVGWLVLVKARYLFLQCALCKYTIKKKDYYERGQKYLDKKSLKEL